MIAHTVTEYDILKHASSCYGYFVTHNAMKAGVLPAPLQQFQDEVYPDLQAWLAATKFTGKKLEVKVLPVMRQGVLIHGIFVGLGQLDEQEPIHIEWYRRALAKMVRAATQLSATTLVFALPTEEWFGVDVTHIAQQTASIVTMTNYHFDDYMTLAENRVTSLKHIVIGTHADAKLAVLSGLQYGFCVGNAVNKARYWIDMPPSDFTPEHFADRAQEIARKTGLGITVFNEEQINSMGMGGLGGVSRGSELDCYLVVMEYRVADKDAPTIAFVGKGITFDSGGLSLKPASSMETMKDDMSGAAAVITVMEALAELKPSVNVIGVAAIAENLPSGGALKPGDIVRFYNGRTGEIKNTDAEGRLILADALAYAVKHYTLDAIVDIATLTGACPIALGPYFTALMSQHDGLIDIIHEASELSGDRVWELPLDDDFKPSIKSSVADSANISDGKYGAKTVCAAFFLEPFVLDVPWAHLDIAGTAFNVPDLPYYRPGATGAGVRLLIELAMNWDL